MSYSKTNTLKAVVIAMSGSALSVGAISNANAAATTMYNLTTELGSDFSNNTSACAPCNGPFGSDGWVWGFFGGAPLGSTSSVAKWAGTGGLHTTPFGYNGGGAVNWGLHMTTNGTAEISSQDSVNRYGVGADIDTAKGAWSDVGMLGSAGRRYDLDFGLFKSDVGGTITLNAVAVNNNTATSTANYGFTIIKGMDTGTLYNHHGNWNAGVNASGLTANSLPAGNTQFGANTAAAIANIVAYSIGGTTPSNINTISFNAEPGQIYTIVLGGYQSGTWIDTADGYKLTVSAVPVPGAVWLFGSAMAGLMGFGRRNKRVA